MIESLSLQQEQKNINWASFWRKFDFVIVFDRETKNNNPSYY